MQCGPRPGSQKGRCLGKGLGALAAAQGHGEDELILRTGERHIQKAHLLAAQFPGVDIGQRSVGGGLVGALAVFRPQPQPRAVGAVHQHRLTDIRSVELAGCIPHEHHRELQALGAVDGHDGDAAGPRPAGGSLLPGGARQRGRVDGTDEGRDAARARPGAEGGETPRVLPAALAVLHGTEGGEGAYKTAAYTALSTVHAAEMRSEQMRLLYVALTRAQDKLILTVPLGIGRTSNPFAKAAAFLAAGAGETLNAQAGSFADWLRAALLVHPNGGPLRRLAGNLELPFADTGSTIALTVQADVLPPEEAPAEAEEPTRPEADPALVETLRQGFGWRYPAAALADIPAKVSVTSLVHAAEQTTLERPGFLSKDGLTAAEMGTALHAFLEHADFEALAAVRDAEDTAVLAAVRAERERQAAVQLTPPAIAGKLDVYKILRFVRSEAFRRICGAEDVLRELAFITSLPAAEVMAAQGRALPDGPAADAEVLVQGIADIVLIYPDHLELLDYKTDRRKTPADFVRAYRAQLELYAKAIEKRFAPRRVTYKGIYSLELGELIEV